MTALVQGSQPIGSSQAKTFVKLGKFASQKWDHHVELTQAF